MKEVVADFVAFCRLFANFERALVCCGNVTAAQCAVLQTLLEGSWTSAALARESRVTPGAMTRLLDGLERRGLIQRQADPSDGRCYQIELTSDGAREAARLAGLTERAVELIVFQLPPSAREDAVRSIRVLREAAEGVRDHLQSC